MKKLFALVLLHSLFLGAADYSMAQKQPTVKLPVFKKDTISIVKFGAVSDGISLNTKALIMPLKPATKKVVGW